MLVSARALPLMLAMLITVETAAPSVAGAGVITRVRNYCASAAALFSPARKPPKKTETSVPANEPEVYLGQGYSAQVFISRDPANPHRKVVKKIYKSNEFGDRRYHLDVEGLQALHDLSLNVPGSFSVILGERYVERSDVMEDGFKLAVRLPLIEGRTLQKMLNDPAISDGEKLRLSDIYEAKLALLLHAIEASGRLIGPARMADEENRYFFEGEATKMKMLKADLKGAGEILIKSDNIIVKDGDPNTMTIIDPY